MTSRQLDRVLSSYYDVVDEENKHLRTQLLPGLQDPKEKNNDPLSGGDSKKTSKGFSQQSILFGACYILSNFALDSLNPYLSVYYRQLGLNANEIGIISSVRPFLAILYTPVIGYIADKFAIRRCLLVSSFVLLPIANVAKFFVPKVRTKEYTGFHCNSSSEALKVDYDNYSSAPDDLFPSTKATSIDLYNSSDFQIVFIYLIVINVVAQLVGAPRYPLSNACLLVALGPTKRNQYGYFRGVSGLGSSLGILVGGVALGMTTFTFTHCNMSVEKAQFYVVFILQTAFLVAAPLAWFMSDIPDFKKRNPETSFGISTLARALCNLRYGSVIIVITWLSIASGKMKVFDFWYIKVLGGNYTMMGLTGFISKATLMVVCFCLPTLNKKFGHVPMLVLACLAIGGACICASVITNPAWMVIPLIFRESTHAVCLQTAGAFLGNAVDNQHQSTLQAVMVLLTFGIGGGFGSLLGGGLIENLSPAMSYYIFASVSFGMAIFLAVIQVIVKLTEKTDEKTDEARLLP